MYLEILRGKNLPRQVGKRLIVINFGLQKYEANVLVLVNSWGNTDVSENSGTPKSSI